MSVIRECTFPMCACEIHCDTDKESPEYKSYLSDLLYDEMKEKDDETRCISCWDDPSLCNCME